MPELAARNLVPDSSMKYHASRQQLLELLDPHQRDVGIADVNELQLLVGLQKT